MDALGMDRVDMLSEKPSLTFHDMVNKRCGSGSFNFSERTYSQQDGSGAQ